MKKFFALLLAMTMSLSLVACGGGVDTQPAIDAFNNASDAFNEVANAINDDLDAYPQELIDVMNEMADAMNEHYDILESGQELTEENIAEMISVFGEVEAWSKDVAANLENMTIEATTVDTSTEAIIDYFNYVSPRFDAFSATVNANIEDFPDDFVQGMVDLANGLIGYKQALESGVELSEEERMTILEDLVWMDEWLTEQEAILAEAG